jgi:hypothetical protein
MAVTKVKVPVWKSSLSKAQRRALHNTLQQMSVEGMPVVAARAPTNLKERAAAAAKSRAFKSRRRAVLAGSARRPA